MYKHVNAECRGRLPEQGNQKAGWPNVNY